MAATLMAALSLVAGGGPAALAAPGPAPISSGGAVQLVALNDPAHAADDYFGDAVALSANGREALVGSYGASSQAGAAYLYAFSGGTWPSTPKATFTDPQATADDHFGWSVALSPDGTTAFVAADHATVGGRTDSGAVYVYKSKNGVWPHTPTEAIDDPPALANDYFGVKIAVSPDGSWLAVGAPGTTAGSQDDVGAAYLYEISGGTPPKTPTATFADPVQKPNGYQLFGYGLAISNSGSGAGTSVVGAFDATVSGVNTAGAAYVYSESHGRWSTTPLATLGDPAPAANDFFGKTVAINGAGTLIMSGAQDKTENAQADAGAVFSYTLSKGVWGSSPHQTLDNGVGASNFG
jgi:hypothetical protein